MTVPPYVDLAPLPRPDRMYTGDGARREDHARSHRSTPAGKDIQGSRQTMVYSTRQVLGGPFSHKLPVTCSAAGVLISTSRACTR